MYTHTHTHTYTNDNRECWSLGAVEWSLQDRSALRRSNVVCCVVNGSVPGSLGTLPAGR